MSVSSQSSCRGLLEILSFTSARRRFTSISNASNSTWSPLRKRYPTVAPRPAGCVGEPSNWPQFPTIWSSRWRRHPPPSLKRSMHSFQYSAAFGYCLRSSWICASMTRDCSAYESVPLASSWKIRRKLNSSGSSKRFTPTASRARVSFSDSVWTW